MTDERDNPGVIAPPPLIFLGGLLVGAAISWFYPTTFLLPIVSLVAGAILIAVGFGIIIEAIVQMRRAKTNVEPWKPTTAILDTGVYSFSRNPIYLAMALIYTGASCAFNRFWLLPPLVFVLLVVHFGVIAREESYLTQKFGDEYLNYKSRVRRWI